MQNSPQLSELEPPMILWEFIWVNGKHYVGEITCPSLFVAALFTITKTRKPSEVSHTRSVDTGDVCMYSETLFSHKKGNAICSVCWPSGQFAKWNKSYIWRDKYCMISLICRIYLKWLIKEEIRFVDGGVRELDEGSSHKVQT